MSAQLQTIEPTATSMTAAQATTPNMLLQMAVQQGADLDRLERLMSLQERWEANEARKAYTSAMAAFKSEPLRILKNKHVSFQTSKGKTEYDHATLGSVVATIVAGLARHGLSHSWDTKRLDGGRVQVSCRITHQLGHSETISLDCGLDDSGGKNSIQALGSAITYLQRYTLLAITGLATEDQQDDDGRGYESETDSATAGWADAIRDAASMEDLNRIAAELKQTPPAGKALANIRALWAARAKEIKQ